MANHSDFVIPCSNPAAVETAMRQAKRMIEQTAQRLRTPVNVPDDPRVGNYSLRRALTDVFKVQPGNTSMGQVFQIKENFGLLAQAVTRARALCVSAAHPMCGQSGQLGHSAFAEVGADNSPTFYLCPAFFREAAPDQARTIVHELAHARLGVLHRGGELLDFEQCPNLRLRSFDEAINNAYAYDAFADCVSSLR